jgi:ATP-dependent DNA helicase RecG
MRRLRICEEKSSGIDKVIRAAEAYQLPAPDFRVNQRRTVVTLFGPKDFDDMDREERIRACYQHCALKFVMAERMTNQSLRERFNLPESKAASVSQVIALATQSEMIRLDEKLEPHESSHVTCHSGLEAYLKYKCAFRGAFS